MPIRLTPQPTFRDRLADTDRPLVGMWVCTGSALNAEICAGSGLDWILIDGEHGPNTLDTIVPQLQAIAAYPATPLVRAPFGEPVIIKQLLDIGAQNLIVPMVNTPQDAAAAVSAVRYPPHGIRGVGSALARASRWNRYEDYLANADSTVSLTVQIETAQAVENAAEIAGTDGVHALFIGPSDLAASMGLLGRQGHPDVVAAVESTIRTAKELGVPVGVNAFDPAMARRYVEAGADFVAVAADVALLARASEKLADEWITGENAPTRASY
ncbi:2,4-dihydroxyhept-2-enedioate aldolase [Paramicrobacterium humi]|uniref:2,4-dihydroxyhept-2-enedioate aldolase n=1 Tax=Paramicrobacterium humi TaxID=640635 RepID=A0A1H4NN25_9MICO|nr:HpcH/HpaI aldolase/citrate lyase family protein [Microbacterium humi]SEB96494.1 2,4-dihydroxyhept-2-enedioate aldolase [Microbacterium humi]